MTLKTNKQRALIADGDRNLATAIKGALKAGLSTKYQTDVASDGAAAIEKWQQRKHALVIIDISSLQKRPGLTVIESILTPFEPRSNNVIWNKRPVIIVITRNSGAHHKEYALDHGADAYIRKPFKMTDLIATIKDKTKRLD